MHDYEKLADGIIATYNKAIPEKKLMSDFAMENPYIGPNGNDIHSEEELNATYEAIRRAELERELESFYSLPLNMRQSIMKQYCSDYIKSLGIDNLSPKSGINHK